MAPRSALVAAASVQLAANLAGQVVALRRRRAYDVPFMSGSPEHVARDSLWFGTAYSAPSYMLASQAWAALRLRSRPDDRARWMLRVLGTCMIPGYLSERMCRRHLGMTEFDRVETPIILVGFGGALAMAILGRPPRGRSGQPGVWP